MSDLSELRRRVLELPPKRLALLALELQAELERERSARSEPIAVVGMACRFPGGADSPEKLWRLLRDGRDAIVPVPADRWPVDEYYDPDPDAPGKMATRWGGFLDDVARFDAAFFSISPREARAMDPQHRLLLETTWRAFEDAAIDPRAWRGRPAGVFVGICANDYLARLLAEGPGGADVYLATGNAFSLASGRLSFTLGFQGPALSIDTACSASLVAVHSACQSLRLGESGLAVAAGVNVICAPETTISLSRAHALAADGRCKTFDEAADGYVRAEGCGVLLLKRLTDARAAGDRIHALLRGSAVNQDGPSGGLTVPSGPAQEQVLRGALTAAGLAPGDIDYIEAHGTGTALGDPIEVRALARVFGPVRDRPLLLGSIKTNLGHLESAAGVAGLMKAILAVREGRIPPHLHFRTPSTRIDWDACPIEVPVTGREWPATGRPRRAGVSSFGFSGTNAHVIVEQAPDPPVAPAATRSPAVELVLASGFTPDARSGVARAYADAVATAPGLLPELAHTARVGRAHLPHRLAVVVADARELRAALAREPEAPQVFASATACGEPPPLVFLFPGQGCQYPGMGRALYESAPAFRAAIDRCAEVLDPLLGTPLPELLFAAGGDDAPVYRAIYAQPGLVAFEYALASQWRAWGIQPAGVVGHSLGEFAAAAVAGAIDLESMLRLVHERGRLLGSLPAGDRMMAVLATPQVVEELLHEHGGGEIAVFNAPQNTVISGPAQVLDAVAAACAARGIDQRSLRIDLAAHSSRVQPILDALEACARQARFAAPEIPIAWNVTGTVGDSAPPTPTYVRRHAREPVRFAQGIRALAARGYRHFLEVGPHATLTPLVAETLAVERPVLVHSLRRGGEVWRDMLEALGQLYVAGAEPDWAALDATPGRRRILIPGHPFAGQRYWLPLGARASGDGRPQVTATAPEEDGTPPLEHYRVSWQPAATPSPERAAAGPSRWALLADSRGVGDALAAALQAAGAAVTLVRRGEIFSRTGEDSWQLDPLAPEHWRRLLAELSVADAAPLGVVHLWSLDTDPADEDGGSMLDQVVRLGPGSLQALAARLVEARTHARLWIATMGAQPITEDPADISPVGGALWGFGRALGAEHGELWGGLVDLDPAIPASEAAGALARTLGSGEGVQFVLRDGRSLVPRLRRSPAPAGAQLDLSAGTTLVTGGLGGIGLELARRVVERGCRSLVLIGRHIPPPEPHAGVPAGAAAIEGPPGSPVVEADDRWTRARRILRELDASGTAVRVVAVDVTDAPALAALRRQLLADGAPPVHNIFHAAGVVHYGALAELTAEQLHAELAPKVAGAINLAQAFGTDIRRLVFFSSASTFIASPLIAAYAAGNAFLDACALDLRRRGFPATSVSWGAWGTVGMGQAFGGDQRGQTGGLRTFTPADGLDALEAVLAGGSARAAVLRMDWSEWARLYPDFARDPFYRDVVAARVERLTGPGGSTAELAALDPAARRAMLLEQLRRIVGRVLRVTPAEVDATLPLRKLGLDSLMALEIKNRVQRDLGSVLSIGRLVKGASLAELMDEMAREPTAPTPVGIIDAAPAPGLIEGEI